MRLLLAVAFTAASLCIPATVATLTHADTDVVVVDAGRTPEQNWQAWQDCLAAGGHSMISPDPASSTLICQP